MNLSVVNFVAVILILFKIITTFLIYREYKERYLSLIELEEDVYHSEVEIIKEEIAFSRKEINDQSDFSNELDEDFLKDYTVAKGVILPLMEKLIYELPTCILLGLLFYFSNLLQEIVIAILFSIYFTNILFYFVWTLIKAPNIDYNNIPLE